MAKYDIKYSCGHEATVNLFGPTRERERKAEWMHTILCPECKKAAEAEARKERAREMGFPDLIGTEKQVAWADKIRSSVLELGRDPYELLACERSGMSRESFDRAVDYAFSQEGASWWIVHRQDNLEAFIGAVLKEIRENEMENSPEALAAKGEMVIMEPDKRKCTSTVCTLTSTSNAVLIRSDRNEYVRRTVKACGFFWDGARNAWTKDITEMTGPAKDLVPDTARILLENGIIVKTYESIFQAVKGHTYDKECHRWVDVSREGDRLAINKVDEIGTYPDGKTTYRGDYVLVDPAKWRDVREFAEMNCYRITKKAEEMLRKAEAATVSVKLPDGKTIQASAEDALKAILDSSRDILSDLKEED